MTIKRKLKSLLAEEEIKLKDIAQMLAEKRNCKVLANGLSQKINRGSMKFDEVEEILELIGYEIEFKKK